MPAAGPIGAVHLLLAKLYKIQGLVSPKNMSLCGSSDILGLQSGGRKKDKTCKRVATARVNMVNRPWWPQLGVCKMCSTEERHMINTDKAIVDHP